MKWSRLVMPILAVLTLLPPPADSSRAGIVGAVEVSKSAGLGRLELSGHLAAVLQRDEGIVALVDISNPRRPKVVGRYSDDARNSLDGDLAFSADGRWLLYARQTEQFSKDGIHVLDVSDPSAPALRLYMPAGGAFRIAYHADDNGEWVILLDAIFGLVVYRFEPTSGILVPVHVQPLPALKVGGPASAGLFVEPRDPRLKKPLLYVTTGRTGLEVFDLSNPSMLELLGSWNEVGLAEVEVSGRGGKRLVFAATEYWFDKQLKPEVIVLDASDLGSIRERERWAVGCPADDQWRIQGMAPYRNGVMVAHSHWGLVDMSRNAGTSSLEISTAKRNPDAKVTGGAPYVFDVEIRRGLFYVTDAANGYLTIASGGSLHDMKSGVAGIRHCA